LKFFGIILEITNFKTPLTHSFETKVIILRVTNITINPSWIKLPSHKQWEY